MASISCGTTFGDHLSPHHYHLDLPWNAATGFSRIMTTAIDSSQQRYPLALDHMSSYSNQPHFTNPWVSSSSSPAPHAPPQSSSHGMYMGGQGGLHANPLNLEGLKAHHQQPVSRASTSSGVPLTSYGTLPSTTAASAGSPHNLLSLSRLPVHTSAAYADPTYTTTASPIHPTYAASPTPYEPLGYAPAAMRSTFAMPSEADQRRYSQSSMQSDDRRGFQDAIEASHGIMSLSQDTPRPIYGSRTRGSGDSYGFPSAHSTSSSVSSTGGFSGYYGGSIDGSVSDYSTAGSDIESVTSGRTPLPRPHGMMSNPPAPQSMMTQFSSKVAASTQKKHKCKVCDKRFTRPSSLQTHMYSHTGEKPYCCEVEGCGRHFSVVSNLRRHRKVHKNQAPSEAGSEDHQSD